MSSTPDPTTRIIRMPTAIFPCLNLHDNELVPTRADAAAASVVLCIASVGACSARAPAKRGETALGNVPIPVIPGASSSVSCGRPAVIRTRQLRHAASCNFATEMCTEKRPCGLSRIERPATFASPAASAPGGGRVQPREPIRGAHPVIPQASAS
jgi:hypothetical protein